MLCKLAEAGGPEQLVRGTFVELSLYVGTEGAQYLVIQEYISIYMASIIPDPYMIQDIIIPYFRGIGLSG